MIFISSLWNTCASGTLEIYPGQFVGPLQCYPWLQVQLKNFDIIMYGCSMFQPWSYEMPLYIINVLPLLCLLLLFYSFAAFLFYEIDVTG